jgi:hypothetical protein
VRRDAFRSDFGFWRAVPVVLTDFFKALRRLVLSLKQAPNRFTPNCVRVIAQMESGTVRSPFPGPSRSRFSENAPRATALRTVKEAVPQFQAISATSFGGSLESQTRHYCQ